MAVKITIRPNGPYRVEPADGIELYAADGSKFDLTGKPGISLCRCGGSVNKPFLRNPSNRFSGIMRTIFVGWG